MHTKATGGYKSQFLFFLLLGVNANSGDMETSESKSTFWEKPTTLMQDRNSNLKRGPSLTFMDIAQPKIINFSNENEVNSPPKFSNFPKFQPSIPDPKMSIISEEEFKEISNSQEDLEADYFMERQSYGDNKEDTARIDLNQVNFYDDYDVDLKGGSFDQLVTFKPDHKADKFGYAQIINHNDHDDYLAPSASSGHEDHQPAKGILNKSFIATFIEAGRRPVSA